MPCMSRRAVVWPAGGALYGQPWGGAFSLLVKWVFDLSIIPPIKNPTTSRPSYSTTATAARRPSETTLSRIRKASRRGGASNEVANSAAHSWTHTPAAAPGEAARIEGPQRAATSPGGLPYLTCSLTCAGCSEMARVLLPLAALALALACGASAR
jgi:hypothetical protein